MYLTDVCINHKFTSQNEKLFEIRKRTVPFQFKCLITLFLIPYCIYMYTRILYIYLYLSNILFMRDERIIARGENLCERIYHVLKIKCFVVQLIIYWWVSYCIFATILVLCSNRSFLDNIPFYI